MTVKRKSVSTGIGLLLSVGLVAGTASATSAAPGQPVLPSSTDVTAAQATPGSAETAKLTDGLDFIMSIPDSVLAQGDAATQQWVAAQQSQPSGGTVQPAANILSCSGAIAVAIAGVALPAAKILKIKKLANELGGVSEAVKLMWGASFQYEKMQAAGGALAALGAELLGIAAIQQECFN